MLAESSLLAQLRPAVVTPTAAYIAPVQTEVTLIVICNTTGAPASFSIYHDDDGTTFDETTALFFTQSLAANETFIRELASEGAGISIAQQGSLAVQSSVASALTFSIYGQTANIIGLR